MVRVLRALAITLIIEVPIVAGCFPRQRLRMVLVAILANTFTNLMLNAVLPSLIHRYYVVVGEILAVIVEAAAYAVAARPCNTGRALAISAICNALSYEFGGMLLAVVGY